MIARGNSRASSIRSRGFTLIEVMVAMFVVSIGLLGLAKIQALAYASTSTASMRSLVALQAAGLASSMHANRNYWGAGGAPPSFTITGTTISDATLNATATASTACNFGAGAPCVPATLAANDLHNWATQLNTMLGNSSPVTTITCPVTIPVNCQIMITWNERAVSINSQSAGTTSNTTFAPSYMLYVEP
jgi:type IV pilus assembly protein PilV